MIKRVFNTTYAKCEICGTPTNGERYYGDKYYCAEHYEKESPGEKFRTEQMLKDNQEARKFLEAVE